MHRSGKTEEISPVFTSGAIFRTSSISFHLKDVMTTSSGDTLEVAMSCSTAAAVFSVFISMSNFTSFLNSDKTWRRDGIRSPPFKFISFNRSHSIACTQPGTPAMRFRCGS
ncbi:hypothetical protein ATCV1_z078R [Acanthocystis turfacea chlorella virus 1]|uniref:Uncharacterized protein z078R n=1 Tax=Chlorovirus heliozoae TaxID=322019 RepID=A7K838_9PHYC|nr:hypothetical protein ATCV1_z078R [Acanthocystis turfacea chlorella virus 1]ABT16212.1 hypothetical protein ATCV1_z078R [Acanthocystis turfacea chlorella virus 1]